VGATTGPVSTGTGVRAAAGASAAAGPAVAASVLA